MPWREVPIVGLAALETGDELDNGVRLHTQKLTATLETEYVFLQSPTVFLITAVNGMQYASTQAWVQKKSIRSTSPCVAWIHAPVVKNSMPSQVTQVNSASPQKTKSFSSSKPQTKSTSPSVMTSATAPSRMSVNSLCSSRKMHVSDSVTPCSPPHPLSTNSPKTLLLAQDIWKNLPHVLPVSVSKQDSRKPKSWVLLPS